MKKGLVFIALFMVSSLSNGQIREALIKYDSSSIRLNFEDFPNNSYAKGIIRLSFKSEDSLLITSSELIFLKIFNSSTKEELFDYNDKDRFEDETFLKSKSHYEYLIDSIFKSKHFFIVNEDYNLFVNRADFPFKLIINSR